MDRASSHQCQHGPTTTADLSGPDTPQVSIAAFESIKVRKFSLEPPVPEHPPAAKDDIPIVPILEEDPGISGKIMLIKNPIALLEPMNDT